MAARFTIRGKTIIMPAKHYRISLPLPRAEHLHRLTTLRVEEHRLHLRFSNIWKSSQHIWIRHTEGKRPTR